MSDDIIPGSPIPSDDLSANIDFDPNAVDSDIFLDDPKDIVPDLDLDDEMPEDE